MGATAIRRTWAQRLEASWLVCWLAVGLVAGSLCGCATTPLGSPPGSSVGGSGGTVPTLQGSYHRVRRGETLWGISQSYGLAVHELAAANRIGDTGQLRVGQKLFIPLPMETDRFLWPVRGRSAAAGSGVRIHGASGGLVRASRGGRIAVAARRVRGWGPTIVIDHLDGNLTVYAGLDQLLVTPGMDVRQGMPIGTLNTRPLYFEIRRGVRPQNTLGLLP